MDTRKRKPAGTSEPCTDSRCAASRHEAATLRSESQRLTAEVHRLEHENTYLQQTVRSLHWALGTALDYVRSYQKRYGLRAKFRLIFQDENNYYEEVRIAE